MPIYEYHCDECSSDFELFLRSSSEDPECPSCGGHELNKKFSTFCRGSGPDIPHNGYCACGQPGDHDD